MHVVYDEIECVAFWEKGLNMGLIKFVLIGFRLRKWIKCENAIIWVCRINLMCLSPKCRWEYRLMIYLFKTEMKYGQWAVVDKSLVDYPPPNFLLNIWVNVPNVGFAFYPRPSCFRTWKHSLNLTWCWRLTGFKPHDVENVGESIYSLRCHMSCGFTGWKSSCMQIQIVKCIVVKSSVFKWTLRVQLNLSLDMVFGVTILFLFEEVFFCVCMFSEIHCCAAMFLWNYRRCMTTRLDRQIARHQPLIRSSWTVWDWVSLKTVENLNLPDRLSKQTYTTIMGITYTTQQKHVHVHKIVVKLYY